MTWNVYLAAAQAYAAGVRNLFEPGAATAPQAASRGLAAAAGLEERAQELAPLSAELTRAAGALLDHADPLARSHAAGRLLAKSLTDLQVSSLLLAAAQPAGGQPALTRGWNAPAAPAPVRADVEEGLGVLLAEPPAPWSSSAVRALADAGPADPAARTQLAQSAVETLAAVRNRAAQAGQAALGGLLGMSLAEVAQAAGVVGLDVAKALGCAPAATRLYGQAREFLFNAYNALVTALGPALTRSAANQVTAWVAELQSGAEFERLLDRLYETGPTGSALSQLAASSPAGPDKFAAAGQALTALQAQYNQQAALVEKAARVLVLAGGIPTAAMPHGRLLLAGAFVALGGYIVLAGADFVDAPRMRLIDRVPGVRRVLEADLGPAPAPAPGATPTPQPVTTAPVTPPVQGAAAAPDRPVFHPAPAAVPPGSAPVGQAPSSAPAPAPVARPFARG